MRDGWEGLNRLTPGAACIPDAAVNLFAFSAGSAAGGSGVRGEPATDEGLQVLTPDPDGVADPDAG